MQDYSFKIILLGNSGVGKTSIYFYYTKNIFQDKYVATVGVDFATDFKNVLGKNVRLNIWDTAGEENIDQQLRIISRALMLVFSFLI